MANHKSAEKRARQTLSKTIVNKSRKNTVRTFEKKLKSAIELSDKESAHQLFIQYASAIGKAVKKHIFHKNTASRKISRLSLAINKIEATEK